MKSLCVSMELGVNIVFRCVSVCICVCMCVCVILEMDVCVIEITRIYDITTQWSDLVMSTSVASGCGTLKYSCFGQTLGTRELSVI